LVDLLRGDMLKHGNLKPEGQPLTELTAGFVYLPQLVGGAVAAAFGCAILPSEIPILLPVAVLAGVPTFVLARRRWRRAQARTGISNSLLVSEPHKSLSLAPMVLSALPILGLAGGAFLVARFTTDGGRFAVLFVGSCLAGQAIGVSIGRLSEYGFRTSIVSAARSLFRA